MNYSKIYDDFISSRMSRAEPSGYCEMHHIVPRSLGGSDHSDNLIKLTGREHFFAHLLLAKVYGGVMWYPMYMMRGSRYGHVSSHTYEMCRVNAAKVHSDFMQGRTPPNKGVKMSDEQKVLLSKAHTGKILSTEHRMKVLTALRSRERDAEWSGNISKALKGRVVGQEVRDKISNTLKGNIPKNKGVPDTRVKCPHCGKVGGRSVMKRWHFDRCKINS